MKTNTLLSACMLVFAMAASAWAVSPGTSVNQGSAFRKETQKPYEPFFNGAPTRLGFGVYYSHQNRGIDVGGSVQDWQVKHTVGYATVDITSWLTLMGGGGSANLSADGQTDDNNAEWVVGGTLRLLDYFAMDPIVGEDPYWVSLSMESQYSATSAGDLSWSDFYNALLVNIMSRTERWGFVDRITLYLGPAYSVINGSDDLREDKALGLVVGVALDLSDTLTLKTELQKFDDVSWGLGASFHF